MLRRTPCIGTCSTTYGDLVCRGCKRFAHEIVQWNGFDQGQRRVVWERLLELRAGAVASVLELVDESRLRAAAPTLGVTGGDELDAANLVYEVLQRMQWRETAWHLDALGLRLRTDGVDGPAELLAQIDREFYHRSLAQYERNYRIPAE
jgi:predicted Fe-S protein YdhL (DUF1289 family)